MDGVTFYADSTCLIGLARIDALELLRLLSAPVLVTATVWDEVCGDTARPGVAALIDAASSGVLEVVQEGQPDAFPELGPGESSVVSAAAASRSGVLIDERKARVLIRRDPQLRESIPAVSGLLGLILLAKRRGTVQSVRSFLDRLEREGFWLGEAIRRQVLQQAGEEQVDG